MSADPRNDRSAWAAANPAMGYRIDPEFIADRLEGPDGLASDSRAMHVSVHDLRVAAALLRNLAAENDRLRAEVDRRTDPDLTTEPTWSDRIARSGVSIVRDHRHDRWSVYDYGNHIADYSTQAEAIQCAVRIAGLQAEVEAAEERRAAASLIDGKAHDD